MRHRVPFAEILEDKLAGGIDGRSRTAGAARIATGPVFLFEAPAACHPAPGPTRIMDFAARGQAPDVRPGPRPARSLSPREQAAFDRLTALGAVLTPGFTDRELRSAFRAMARRYHPDRHPGLPAADRARLSRQFVELSDAYRALQPGVPLAA